MPVPDEGISFPTFEQVYRAMLQREHPADWPGLSTDIPGDRNSPSPGPFEQTYNRAGRATDKDLYDRDAWGEMGTARDPEVTRELARRLPASEWRNLSPLARRLVLQAIAKGMT